MSEVVEQGEYPPRHRRIKGERVMPADDLLLSVDVGYIMAVAPWEPDDYVRHIIGTIQLLDGESDEEREVGHIMAEYVDLELWRSTGDVPLEDVFDADSGDLLSILPYVVDKDDCVKKRLAEQNWLGHSFVSSEIAAFDTELPELEEEQPQEGDAPPRTRFLYG